MELLVLIVSLAIFSVLNISLMPLHIGPPTRKRRSGNCTSRGDYSSGAAPLRNLHIYKHHFHRTITMGALYMLRTTAPIHKGRCKRLFLVHFIWKKMFLQTSTKNAWAQAVGMSNWRCARSSKPPQQMWAVGGIAATKIRTANRVGQYLPLDHAELSNFGLQAGFSNGRK